MMSVCWHHIVTQVIAGSLEPTCLDNVKAFQNPFCIMFITTIRIIIFMNSRSSNQTNSGSDSYMCDTFLQMNRNKYREMEEQRHYEYDAFISYSVKDFHWVSTHLPRLEKEYHLRMCLHDRDWLVGRDIVDNIVASIENSRKTVLIVSNAFAISQWCHFELAMVQTRLLELDRDNVVLVLLEEILDANMSPRLRLQMQKQTYIEWPDYSEAGQQLFLVKLNQALSKPSVSQMNAAMPSLETELLLLK